MRRDNHIHHIHHIHHPGLQYHQIALASDGLSKEQRIKRKRKKSQVCLLL